MDLVAQALADYGWVAVIVYILVKDGLAVLKRLLPETARRNTEREKRTAACEEREATALENIARNLTISNERLTAVERTQGEALSALAAVVRGIDILLDRSDRKKKLPAPA